MSPLIQIYYITTIPFSCNVRIGYISFQLSSILLLQRSTADVIRLLLICKCCSNRYTFYVIIMGCAVRLHSHLFCWFCVSESIFVLCRILYIIVLSHILCMWPLYYLSIDLGHHIILLIYRLLCLMYGICI